MKILLIAGHGAADTGAVAFGRREADLTRELVILIQKHLGALTAECELYDMKRSAYHDMITCGYDYNFKKFNYVLEVHFNASQTDYGNGSTKGCEIFVTRAEKVVTAEQAVVKEIAGLGFKNRGVKRADMSVIHKAKTQGVSGALLEVCFMDDADDIKLYMSNKDKVAKAIVYGIKEGFKLQEKAKPVVAPAKPNNEPSAWAKASWDKAKALGITDGLRPHDTCTREELVVMLDRAGVLKK